jgi:hypothetical protein
MIHCYWKQMFTFSTSLFSRTPLYPLVFSHFNLNSRSPETLPPIFLDFSQRAHLFHFFQQVQQCSFIITHTYVSTNFSQCLDIVRGFAKVGNEGEDVDFFQVLVIV